MLKIKAFPVFLLIIIVFSLNAMTTEGEKLKAKKIDLASQGILLSIQNDNLSELKYFLSQGGLPDKYKDQDGKTALILEIEKKESKEEPNKKPNIEIIKWLLAGGADPNLYGAENVSPLMLEVEKSKPTIEIIKLLLNAGANPNAEDKFGNTLLFVIIPSTLRTINVPTLESPLKQSYAIAQALLNKGADPNKANKFGQTPLHRLINLIPTLENRKDYIQLSDFINLMLIKGANPVLQPKIAKSLPAKTPLEFLDSLYNSLKQVTTEKTPGQLALQIKLIENIRKQIELFIKKALSDLLSRFLESLSTLKQALK